MARRIAFVVVGLAALWLVALFVLDFALAGRQAAQLSVRVGESLQATATVADTDLALVRGRLTIDGLGIHRDDDIGHLALDVAQVRCELPPLGWALVDRGCRELAVRGVRLDVSTAALFHIKNPKRPPIHTDRVVIDDAVLAFSPSAFLPSLGEISIHIDHAEAGPTVMRTPLSWLFALETLHASLELPAGITLHLTYADGMLGAGGSLFGSTPVTLPVQLPVASLYGDAHDETQALVKLGKELAEQLVAKRAEDWLKIKLER
jgi:hypothetical protein